MASTPSSSPRRRMVSPGSPCASMKSTAVATMRSRDNGTRGDGAVDPATAPASRSTRSFLSVTSPPGVRLSSPVGLLGLLGRCLDVVRLHLVDGGLDDGIRALESLPDPDGSGVGDESEQTGVPGRDGVLELLL